MKGLWTSTTSTSQAIKHRIESYISSSTSSPNHTNLSGEHPTTTVTMSLHQNTGSSTCVISPAIEIQPISHNNPTKPQNAKVAGSHTSLRLSDTKGIRDDDSPTDLPSPTTHSAHKPEQWNHPRSNLFKTMAAFWSFVVMGSNDAAYGALIPYVSSFLIPNGNRVSV